MLARARSVGHRSRGPGLLRRDRRARRRHRLRARSSPSATSLLSSAAAPTSTSSMPQAAAARSKSTASYSRTTTSGPQRAARFAQRVRDVTEVLDAMELGSPSRAVDATVTYQEPCHLVHAQRVSGRAATPAGARSGTAPRRDGGERGVLRERRHLQPHATRDGRAPAAPQGRRDQPHRRDDRSDRQSRLRDTGGCGTTRSAVTAPRSSTSSSCSMTRIDALELPRPARPRFGSGILERYDTRRRRRSAR